MKNIYKDRFESCNTVSLRKVASKSHEVFSMLSECLYAFGMRPFRADAEVEVQDLGQGKYKIVQEAPDAGKWAEGYRSETLVHVYKRGGELFLKMVESVRLRVGATSEQDRKIVSECVRGGRASNPNTMEGKFLVWLRSKIELD